MRLTKIKIFLINSLLAISFFAVGQTKTFRYKREIGETTKEWNKILLPGGIFEKTSPDFSDLRILGLTKSKDTIEAPYILRVSDEKTSIKELPFSIINQSKNNNGHYFTFETPTESTVNQIDLNFAENNFDWRINLEGSQDQKEWVSIIEDYRIMSIKNDLCDYQFTKIVFPNSKYRFYRMLILCNQNPKLNKAKMSLCEITEGTYQTAKTKSTKIQNNKSDKQTTIDIQLNSATPISKLKIYINDKIDYFRPITIQYLADSTKTPQGWIRNYETLTQGTLSSIEKNEFKFNSTILKILKVTIENQDNQALQIDSIQTTGYEHFLLARFNKPAEYYLMYGKANMAKPQYDITYFEDKIPKQLNALMLGEEQVNEGTEITKTSPLFMNKMWLWSIMAVIIVLLGWFTLKMIRTKS